MKKINILFFAGFVICCNTSQNNSKELMQNDIYSNDRIEKLKYAFEKKDYLGFFNIFPATYKEFVSFYGYDDIKGEYPLYDMYEQHIDYLFQNKFEVQTHQFAEKIYGIAKDGVWEADAVALFHSNLSKFIIENPNIIIDILATKSDIESSNFWHFVFDGSSKHDAQNLKKYNTVYNLIKAINFKQSQILKFEFENMYEE